MWAMEYLRHWPFLKWALVTDYRQLNLSPKQSGALNQSVDQLNSLSVFIH